MTAIGRTLCLFLSLALVGPTLLWPATAPTLRGEDGAVVSAEPASTEVGLAILRRGGNAVDAAVATALAMVVVHPQAGNLGGGGFAVVRVGDELASLDFRESAPQASHRDMYLDSDGRPIADASWIGPLAAGVPGSPAGLFALHERFGTLPWQEIVKPAVLLARDGFRVSSRLHGDLVTYRNRLERFPETSSVWLPGGEVPEPGSRLQLPQLAATLAVYAAEGPQALVQGPIAERIEEAVAKHGGVLTAADLAAYRPAWRQPLRFEALGWQFAGMDLPASGGFLVAGSLQLAERLELAKLPRFGARRAHLLSEIWRRVYADRVHLGDPSSTRVRVGELLQADRLDRLAESIDLSAAAESTAVRGWPTVAGRESPETIHVSAIDRDGNLVAMTTTLNGTFGCGLIAGDTGILLNNEMDDFATAPGQPNHYGLVQGPANEIAPGRRMLSSMSPTLAWRGDEAVVLGGRGGSRIPTGVVQVLLHLLLDGDPLQTAVNRPRIHHQWLPDRILSEDDALAPETSAALEALGHRIEVSPKNAKVNAARLLPDGRVEAAGDPRGPAAAGVVTEQP